jgi:hypothetical protein
MCFASNGTFQKVKSYPFSGRTVIRRNRLSRSCIQVQSRSPIALQNFSAVRFFIQHGKGLRSG